MKIVIKIFVLLPFLFIYSVGMLAQVNHKECSLEADFYNLFDYTVDWTAGHTLINAKGKSISMVNANVKYNPNFSNFKWAMERFSSDYSSDSLPVQINKLEQNRTMVITPGWIRLGQN